MGVIGHGYRRASQASLASLRPRIQYQRTTDSALLQSAESFREKRLIAKSDPTHSGRFKSTDPDRGEEGEGGRHAHMRRADAEAAWFVVSLEMPSIVIRASFILLTWLQSRIRRLSNGGGVEVEGVSQWT